MVHLAVIFVSVYLLSAIDAQCVLQTCDNCEIHDACEVANIPDIHNVTSCIDMIDNVTVLAVEYRPDESRCITASCAEMSHSYNVARTYSFTCKPGCRSFSVSIKTFSEIVGTPSSVHQVSTIGTCLTVCLEEEESCWMYDVGLITCIMYSMCGPTHNCSTKGSYFRSMLYRKCITDCGTPIDLTNGLVSYKGTLVDDVAIYTCNPGFLLLGESISICQNNSHWSVADTICELTSTLSTTNATTTSTETQNTEQTTTVGNSGSIPTTTITETIATTQSSTDGETTSTTNLTTDTTTSQPASETSLITQTTTTTRSVNELLTGSRYRNIKALYIWPCYCKQNLFADNMTIADVVRQLIAETIIDRKSTSVAINKLVSKQDNRTSANAIGVVGIVILTLLLCILIVVDVSKVCILSKAHKGKNKNM